MNHPENSQLGKSSAYIDQYDASLLFPIPRSGKRAEIGIAGAAPFMGADMWTAFELSWLNLRGKPQVALAHFTIPCESHNIIESKSFKLYLNSFNNTKFTDLEAVKTRLRADIFEAVWRTPGDWRASWRPIATAPKRSPELRPWDADLILYLGDGLVITGRWDYEDRWIDSEGDSCVPTHWMPLPEPPK